MSGWLVIVIGLVYLYIAIEQASKGQWGYAVMWAGYALANGGLFVAMQKAGAA